MNAILISVKPKWAMLEMNGKKLIEIRKNYIEPPFKVFNYVTYGTLLYSDYPKGNESREIKLGNFKVTSKNHMGHQLNGKVAFEYVVNKVDKYAYDHDFDCDNCSEMMYYIKSGELEKTCLTYRELERYGKDKTLYGWHISDVIIYDKPKDLRDFKRPCIMPEMPYCPNCKYGYTTFPEDTTKQDIIDGCECKWGCLNTVTRPPQNYMFVEEL